MHSVLRAPRTVPEEVASSAHEPKFALLRPGPPLGGLVDCFWAADEYVAQASRERVLPTGGVALVVPLGEHPLRVYEFENASECSETSGALLCGARETPLIIDTLMGPTAGVHFTPGGARAFFGLPASLITGRTVALETVWGASALSLRERLLEATHPLRRVRLLQAFLLERARGSPELSPALRLSLAAFEEPGLPSVAEVNRRTGLSPKRLLALFRDEVGLSPKAYWRVRRFQAALRDLDQGTLHGAGLAHEHGYCDQAHFIREFRALAGSCPREYLADRVPGTGHVSVHGKKDPIRGVSSCG